MNFVAIDFETANASRSSVCSVAAVTVENGEIVRSAYSLIRPLDMHFDWRNIEVHGITAKDVMNKPTFIELWERIRPHLEGKTVIAHNAAFDIGVLRSVLEEGNLPFPAFQHACTLKIAKKVWPQLANHKLSTLANYFQIDFNHHNALHDAKTCALIALRAQKELQVGSFIQLMQKLSLQIKKFA
jgi:DNA polymerase-3 subunit epsilon